MSKLAYYSTKDAAELFMVSDQTILNWLNDGMFPNAIKLNPKKKNSPIRIPREDIEKVLQAQARAVGKKNRG
jgi:predicted site-specific integrase-resolvase